MKFTTGGSYGIEKKDVEGNTVSVVAPATAAMLLGVAPTG